MPIESKHTRLRLVEIEDAEFILSLRLNEDLNRFISKVDNNIQRQKEWIKAYKEREQRKEEYYFIVESNKGEKLGNVRLYDFSGDSFCWGSWIIKNGSPIFVAIESALLVYEYAFYHLGFSKSHFDVRKVNKKVIAFHKRFGAKITSEDELNYYFNIRREDYERIKNKYTKYF